MLRPSRPMIRPFMSSLGRANTLTVDSAVCSEATRWIAIVRILRARSSPSSRACCSISRTCAIAERLASSTTWATSSSRASDEVMPAIRSSCVRCWSAACSSRSRASWSISSRWSSSPLRASSLLVRSRSLLLGLEDPPLEAGDLVAAGLHVLLGLAADLRRVRLRVFVGLAEDGGRLLVGFQDLLLGLDRPSGAPAPRGCSRRTSPCWRGRGTRRWRRQRVRRRPRSPGS